MKKSPHELAMRQAFTDAGGQHYRQWNDNLLALPECPEKSPSRGVNPT